MDAALIEALVRRDALTNEAVRGLIPIMASIAPERLPDLADRPDLDDASRAELLRAARPYEVTEMLDRWPPNVELVDLAVLVHGSSPRLVAYCGAQGWVAKAARLAAGVRPEEATAVPARWEDQVGYPVPPEVRLALLDAAVVDRSGPTPDFSSMMDWERRDFFEQVEREEEAETRRVWHLIEAVPELWTELAREGRHAVVVRAVLLDRRADLPDDVLIACLPTITHDALRSGTEDDRLRPWRAGLRLSSTASYVRRRPRIRAIAPDALRRVVREAVEDGWTPRDRILRQPDWPAIAGLAVLTDDADLLAAAAAAATAGAATATARAATARNHPAEPSRPSLPDTADWSAERAEAVVALVDNPATPRAALVALVPTLDKRTLNLILERGESELADACHAQLERLRRDAEARRPRLVAVPSDDELARTADPVAELRGHLRHLRASAAQRDLTADGLLRSRYTTPELLRAVPARHVLACSARAGQVADIIIEACGDDLDRWQALGSWTGTKPPPTMTFDAWLERLGAADHRAEPSCRG